MQLFQQIVIAWHVYGRIPCVPLRYDVCPSHARDVQGRGWEIPTLGIVFLRQPQTGCHHADTNGNPQKMDNHGMHHSVLLSV